MALLIPGNQEITHRIGDVYFGKSIQDFPYLPKIYRRLIPKNYNELITEEERTVNFLCIGNPFWAQYDINSLYGKLTIHFLNNIDKRYGLAQLKDATGNRELSDAMRSVRDNFNGNSKYFQLSTKSRKPVEYSLEKSKSFEVHLRELERLDIELGIDKNMYCAKRESLDSSML